MADAMAVAQSAELEPEDAITSLYVWRCHGRYLDPLGLLANILCSDEAWLDNAIRRSVEGLIAAIASISRAFAMFRRSTLGQTASLRLHRLSADVGPPLGWQVLDVASGERVFHVLIHDEAVSFGRDVELAERAGRPSKLSVVADLGNLA